MSYSANSSGILDPMADKYHLALKMYHHRKFANSLDILKSVIEESKSNADSSDRDWIVDAYLLLLKLYNILIKELNSLKLASSSLVFPQISNSPTKTKSVHDELVNGYLFNLVYELHLDQNDEVLSKCIETELLAGVKVESHVGEIVRSNGLANSESVLKTYLEKEILPKQGKLEVRNKLNSMLSLESEDVIRRWFNWVDQLDDQSSVGKSAGDNDKKDVSYDSDYYEQNSEEAEFESEEEYAEDHVNDKISVNEGTNVSSVPHQEVSAPEKKKTSVTSSRPRNVPTSDKLLQKVEEWCTRFGGPLPVISAIMTILLLLNIKKVSSLLQLRRVWPKIQRTIEMAFKITYV